MKILKLIYDIITKGFMLILLGIVALVVILYCIVALPPVQEKLKTIGEEELTRLLTAPVKIEKISFTPFNKLILENATVLDQRQDTIVGIEKLGAGISLTDLIFDQEIVFTFAEVIGLKGNIYRDNPQSPLNLQFIIDALQPKEKNKPPRKFDIDIHNIILRRCKIRYNVLSEPQKEDRFDKNHVDINNLRADIDIPRLKNNDFVFDIRRLSLKETSGFDLTNLSGIIAINDSNISVTGLKINLPHSEIKNDKLAINFSSLSKLGKEITSVPVDLKIKNNYITPADLKCFVPELKAFEIPIYLNADISGNINNINVKSLIINSESDRIKVLLKGKYEKDSANINYNIERLELKATATEIARITSNITSLKPDIKSKITSCGSVSMKGSVKGTNKEIGYIGDLSTDLGSINLNAGAKLNKERNIVDLTGIIKTAGFSLGKLLSKTAIIGDVALDATMSVRLQKGKIVGGKINGRIPNVELKQYRYSDIKADVAFDRSHYSGSVSIDDKNAMAQIDGELLLDGSNSTFSINAQVDKVDLNAINIIKNYQGHSLALTLYAEFIGDKLDNSTGELFVSDIKFVNGNEEGIHVNNFNVIANNSAHPQNIKISSDIVNGSIVGQYNFASLLPAAKDILSHVFPDLINANEQHNKSGIVNKFEYDLTISPNDEVQDFFKLPIRALYDITLKGSFDEEDNKISVGLDAPYLLKGKSIIEGTSLHAELNSLSQSIVLDAHTMWPMKKKKVNVNLQGLGMNKIINTDLHWDVVNDPHYYGTVSLSSSIERDMENKIAASINVNPTEIAFNDSIWTVYPSNIKYQNNEISINSFKASHENQFVNIDGIISKDFEKEAKVDLADISLDYVFETLNINNVTFGGQASGTVYASGLMTKEPILHIPKLDVKGLSYNAAVMGDADIEAKWNNETKGIELDALIKQKNKKTTRIDGAIFPTRDSLALNFHPDGANVAFLKPFVKAFTSSVEGEVSGDATLYGNFSRINLYGDVYADIKMKLDYTNVYYSAKDSIKIEPGYIAFKDITITDRDGHTGIVDGYLKHDYFSNATFNFLLHDISDLLCFDLSSKQSPKWYGTIHGNGSASVSGAPGVVNIGVRMETTDDSKFTFVLSKTAAAGEYNFITFVDRNKKNHQEAIDDDIPEIVRILQSSQAKKNESKPSEFNINLEVDITPEAELLLLMDPTGGDNIKAHGNGHMNLAYSNKDEQINMRGKYVLTDGKYHFTLQDIIIKDFKIAENSSISFDGDPYSANLDIKAIYSLNANITDLDKNFETDRELNRTNVPVHAVLMAKGEMSQPELSFDLEFPTLTSDAYRKVKSIISTDDMMNQQIIYLLALSKFYTPEYMNTTSKGNELASVASSTLSSQLSNILGQLSNSWAIAPNIRSDKGDFSDVEVDVALSSSLLNNRLLFNGNFGYRDNKMNTSNSNFIGDFDIEYLLNRKGTIRLKAYNHFNDRNYYVKNALTTQGVGVEFKFDFNNLRDLLKRGSRKQNINDSIKAKN